MLFTNDRVAMANAFVVDSPKQHGLTASGHAKVVCFTGLRSIDFHAPQKISINGEDFVRGNSVVLSQVFAARAGGSMCCAREYFPASAGEPPAPGRKR